MMASHVPWVYYQCILRLIFLTELYFFLTVQGTCYHEGIYFSTHTIWQPDSCTICSCQDNVAVCDSIHCKNPRCDFHEKESLKIPSNKCCPECEKATKSCIYQDQMFQHNTEWTPNLCTTCTCTDGSVHCTNVTCKELSCTSGQILQNLPATCCPKCIPVGRSCVYQGQTYKDGDEWKPAACTYCKCLNGQAECYIQECTPHICPVNEKLVTPLGGCCPQCIGLSCMDNGKEYESGQQWKRNLCTFCTCTSGEIFCTQTQCDQSLQCPSGNQKINREGECCPECVSVDTSCDIDGAVHFSGEMWKKSECEYCICEKGQVYCHLAVCEKITCSEHDEVVHKPGKCCPECLPALGTCTHQGQAYQSGSTWMPDGCHLCVCNDSQVTCFKQSCHVCPEGTMPLNVKGQCCPLCQAVECAAECSTCGTIGPDYCLSCKDNGKVLQKGKCLEKCDETYFLNSQDKCEACHPTCGSCSGKAEFQCLTCFPGYLLKWGQCVTQCDSSYYEENGICLECHPECLECTGPRDDQCSECSNPGQFLENGECVDDCSINFYSLENECHVCKSSCQSCHHNGVGCITCPEGKYLQDDECVSTCSLGYYQENEFCLNCHSSCQNCSGPLKNLCTSCQQGWVFLHGECLPDGCGDEYFLKDTQCIDCHSSCSRCSGPASTECLSCNNAAVLLPLPGQSFGQCIQECPSQYYLTYLETCLSCHESCKSCYGSGPNSCTECQPSSLLKDGSCVSYCEEHYFISEGLCVECHPSCVSCNGWGSGQCISCPQNTILENNKCVTGCPDGLFKDKKGECQVCPDRCKTCYQTSDTFTTICTQCRSSKNFLKNGTCVADCGIGYYSSAQGVCKVCHSSCETCNKEGVYGCLSCESDLVLTHLGFCTTHCFDGYYPSNGICKECDAACSQCDSEGRCTKCHDPAMVIQFGECLLKCADQYYMEHQTKLCKECDWSCESCNGPHETDCASCMQDMYLQDGSCVQNCKEGFFQQDNICKECSENCLSCIGEDDCKTCVPPFLLLGNVCVPECGLGKYTDYSQHVCIDCPVNCAKCSDLSECILCNKETLLKEGSCVEECGDNYFTDQVKLACEANFDSPVLVINGSLIAEIGGETRLDTTFLTAYDPDTSFENLFLKVMSTPSNGYLVKADYKKDIKLGLHDTFSSSDLARGLIRFVHDRYAELQGVFSLLVSDRQFESPEIDIPISVISHSIPFLVKNQQLIVSEGGEGIISSETVLDIRDQDNEGAVVITTLEGPNHGKLVRYPSKETVTNFRIKDLRLGKLRYQHDNSETQHDLIVFQASDKHNVLNFILEIQIIPKDNKGPVLIINKKLQLGEGQRILLTNDVLQAKDIDSSSEDLIYTLTPPINNPVFGDLFMILPTPPTGLDQNWIDMGDEQMGTKIFKFQQHDLDEGRIWYKHSGNEGSNNDFFIFQVSDSANPPNVLKDQTFNLVIVPANDEAPTLVPGIQLTLTLLENQAATISKSQLAFTDKDSDDRNLIYTITKPLEKGEGSLEHLDHFHDEPLTHFTQADINAMKIIYRPPFTDIGPKEKEFSFRFIVSDSLNVDKNQAAEHEFVIRVVPVNNAAPVFKERNPILVATQGGTVPLQSSVLIVSDADTPLGDLTFKINSGPFHGILEQNGQDKRISVKPGSTFSMGLFMANGLYYMHDGSSSLTDEIKLSVSDGLHSTATTININIIPVDSSSPYLIEGSTLSLTLPEGETVTIEPKVLTYLDEDSSEKDIVFILEQIPMHGSLLKRVQKNNYEKLHNGDKFTQQDIMDLAMSYSSANEIGNEPINDVIKFKVSDVNGNVLPYQLLTVTIVPVNNQPPIVTVNQHLEVEEGGSTILNADVIYVTDVDSSLSSLQVILDSQPMFGYIENTEKAAGSEVSSTGTPITSFSLAALLDETIQYVQNNHKNKEPVEDGFLFHVTDGANESPIFRFNISIMLINDEEPVLVTEQILVPEGGSTVVKNATIYVSDFDTLPEDLVFTLIDSPQHGTLRRREFIVDSPHLGHILVSKSTFTYQDILDELITYSHDGTKIPSDSFSFSITDGLFSVVQVLNVVVGLMRDETPRITINRGLRMPAGSTVNISSKELQATDADSQNSVLLYTVTQNPNVGHLFLRQSPTSVEILSTGQINSFTQENLDKGEVQFQHIAGDPAGTVNFKFMISDPEGNLLQDQTFIITVLEDRIPPKVEKNKGLTLLEGTMEKITTESLSSTDADSEPENLLYTVIAPPMHGHLELLSDVGESVVQFRQADLAAGTLLYVHTSDDESNMDSFTFSVSDGTNQVIQTFNIMLIPVDDSLPVVINNGLRVQEGVKKIITEFEVKAIDLDTKEESIMFTVVEPPQHGVIEITPANGKSFIANTFSMADIYENRVSYKHDGSDTLEDAFSFTVADGTNPLFLPDESSRTPTNNPLTFNIEILPVDDGTPILVTNTGLKYLEYLNGKALNIITRRELQVKDADTPDKLLMYVVKIPPKFGNLESSVNPGIRLSVFTQEDINNGIIRYVLMNSTQETSDSFTFEVADSKPNVVSDNKFHIQWSRVFFEQPQYNISETGGILRLIVKRTGNLKQYSIVKCRTQQGRATVRSRPNSKPGQEDFVEHAGQVQFEEWEDTKSCNIIINDDSVFEGQESFFVELNTPIYSLLGEPKKTQVTIYDYEDEPKIQFEQGVINVNENIGFASIPVTRSGDISGTVSAVCSTLPLSARGSGVRSLESGSDYKTRPQTEDSRVVFLSGVTKSKCDVKIIDDSDYELSEEFQLVLTDPSRMAQIGSISKATIIIEGPNDESTIFLSRSSYIFEENAGSVTVEILRQGSDLSQSSMVWCATRLSDPPSASPGQDYVPSSVQITFGPGQTSALCTLTILDDSAHPEMEGNETFVIFLSSVMGSTLGETTHAEVIITDTEADVPLMQFEKVEYTVKESVNILRVPIIRTGDVSYESSVRCYTRQGSAQVMMDFEERKNSEDSRIIFLEGEKSKDCVVAIINDVDYESDEVFQLKLSDARGSERSGASIGSLNSVSVTITNKEDAPTISIEQQGYSVHEPSAPDQISTVTITIIRSGDTNKTSRVRCSTRDGSAKSGIDYNAKSLILKFKSGERSKEFTVDILHNSETEWHESFMVVLGPDEPINAELGQISTATVTILDHETSGSLVLPAPPIVVSLSDYDNVEAASDSDPSPGYPLICVSPCDSHFPTFSQTNSLCRKSGINESSIHFRWEISMPADADGSRPPFETVTDNTLFTNVNQKVLDSIYFGRRFHVRCVAQPLHSNGNFGVPLRSNTVTISADKGICYTPIVSGQPHGFQSQSFVAKLRYIDTKDSLHPNRIHIHIEIPHQDGMLPLISTLPLNNLRFLLTEPIYRQQHICSNLVDVKEREGLMDFGFMESPSKVKSTIGPGYNKPYQFDTKLRGNKTIELYKHLNLKSCIWTFDAWYHMTELVDICGGAVNSDFQVRDAAQSYLTVRLPLYVSYIYVTAPTGWASMEHRTEMEFSFFYSTILWRSGLETDSIRSARLQVLRILIGDDGKLVVDFKTQANFRGQFVISHHTLPGYISRIVAPEDMVITFDLALLWSAQTFDSPVQLWRATSRYSLKDYSGQYSIELIPCTVKPTQSYTVVKEMPPVCTAHPPEKFTVPIAFQQTNRPVPVIYSLNTEFHLVNNEKMFLLDPKDASMSLQDMDYKGAFSKGQTIYGRVLWTPEQDLNSAYKLQIEKLFLCTGKDGYVPTFDPQGTEYGEGPQYGCIQTNPNLKYRFLILDRSNPEAVDQSFHSIPFEAYFASDSPSFAALQEMPGVDGFTLKVDALYKIDSGHQWYLQVIYIIIPADNSQKRFKRSIIKRELFDVQSIPEHQNGTNMRFLELHDSDFEYLLGTSDNNMLVVIIVAGALCALAFIIVVIVIIFLLLLRHKNQKKRYVEENKSNIEKAQRQIQVQKLLDNNSSELNKNLNTRDINLYTCNDKTGSLKGTVRLKNVNLKLVNNLIETSSSTGTEV